MTDSALTQIKEALFLGRKIDAIKVHREATGSGLAEAKDAVEKLETELRATQPEKFTAQVSSGKGCAAMILMVCVVIGLALVWALK